MIELFFIWAICAVVSAIIASARGLKNGCLWFIVGFLLGPIGVIITAVVPSSKPVPVIVQSQVEMESGAQRVCPHCRSMIPIAAEVCRYCQRESDLANAELAPPPRPNPAFCRHSWHNAGFFKKRCVVCGLVQTGR